MYKGYNGKTDVFGLYHYATSCCFIVYKVSIGREDEVGNKFPYALSQFSVRAGYAPYPGQKFTR